MKDIVDRIWSGATSMDTWTQAVAGGHCTEIAADVAVVSTSYFFGNVTAIRTALGLVLVDTGSRDTAAQTFEALRRWSEAPVHTIIYTHGHIDHTWGARLFDAEADEKGWARPRIVSHRNVLKRFERYDQSRSLNTLVMGQQFNDPGYDFPKNHRRPDDIYDDRCALSIGGVEFVLEHGQGETDDATYVWLPQRSLLISGDFVIWAFPNAGNPRKVQRYAPHWAATLRRMHALQPSVLIPGHGPAIVDATRVSQMLEDGAAVLEFLVKETLVRMNNGARLNEILHSVRAPADLIARPYLLPRYDDPEFVVRGIWHLYGGWYDGNPAHLKPAADHDLAGEIATLAGGAEALAARAEAAAQSGNLRLAAHLVEFAHMADQANARIHAHRAAIYGRVAQAETSLIGKALFAIAERESEKHIKDAD